jgi:hypothetical protein
MTLAGKRVPRSPEKPAEKFGQKFYEEKMNHENHEIETETEQVAEVRTKLETLQKRRSDIESETEAAQVALQAAQRAAISGNGTTAQLSKKSADLATLRELLAALGSEIENAQGEYDRVSYDAHHENLVETLHSACAQHLFVHREAVVPVCQSVNEEFIEADLRISDAETEREITREEARRAFEALCPGILHTLISSPPPDDLKRRALALVEAMRAAGIDTSALQSNDEFQREYWLDDRLDALPDSGLNPALQAARRPMRSARPEHGDVHSSAVAIGAPLTPAPDAAQTPPPKPTGPIFTNNGHRDYIAENLRENGRN